jgi:arylsulfatase A-like enzyme
VRDAVTRRQFLKAAGAGTAGVALFGGASVVGSRQGSYLPKGGAKMNVVLVNLDSLRRDHVGAYGNPWIETPNLDALARESLRFTRPYPESIPTICARRSIYTGIRTWPFRGWIPQKGETFFPAGWQRMPENQTSMTEVLAENGYDTALITDTYHQFKPSMNFHRGYNVFEYLRGQERDRYRAMKTVPEEEVDRYTVSGNDQSMRDKVRQYRANVAHREREEDWFGPRVFLRGMDYLEVAAEVGGPFFLFVDSFDPHEPWDPPEKYSGMYGEPTGTGEPIAPNYDTSDYLEEAELRRMRALYAGEVTLTDKWFGAFVNKMAELGLTENTLLVVFSDHGVSLGEHGYTGKVARAIWPELKDIVFYVRHPEGKGAGKTSDFRVGFQDIAPTVLGQMGIGPPQPMDGQDLAPLLEGKVPAQERTYITLGYDNYSWAEDDEWALSVRNDGEETRLYDLAEDPDMNRNVASANRDVVKRMWNDYVLKDAGGEPPPMY